MDALKLFKGDRRYWILEPRSYPHEPRAAVSFQCSLSELLLDIVVVTKTMVVKRHYETSGAQGEMKCKDKRRDQSTLTDVVHISSMCDGRHWGMEYLFKSAAWKELCW